MSNSIPPLGSLVLYTNYQNQVITGVVKAHLVDHPPDARSHMTIVPLLSIINTRVFRNNARKSRFHDFVHSKDIIQILTSSIREGKKFYPELFL